LVIIITIVIGKYYLFLSYIKNIINNSLYSIYIYMTYTTDTTPCKRSESNLRIKKTKISENDFCILNYDEYKHINTVNYNVKQLKYMCKYYKLKITGNKTELLSRIYNYLHTSYFAIKIQSKIRGYFSRLSVSLRGPALFHNELSTNCNDFYTFDDIQSISFYNFISWREDKNIFSFDIYSLYELIKSSKKDKTKLLNPYNRSEISTKIVNNLNHIIKLNNIHGEKFKINKINEDNEITITTFNNKILNICLRIDSLGNYTDVKWFNSLNRRQTIKFINVLHDIWNYRAQISDEVKREICAPSGKPFSIVNIHYNYLCNCDILQLKMIFVKIIENFINTGINDSSSSLGAMYILSALTLVNSDAANALPWLYQSVAI
jgi:hypothetical protein